MKAAIYYGVRDIRIAERPVPDADNGGILLQVEACAICGSDIRTFLSGNAHVTPPRVLGHEVCGVIRSVPTVSSEDLKVGDRVTVAPAIGCGSCRECQSGSPNMCANLRTVGFEYDGGFAEYMLVPREAYLNVVKVPDGLSSEYATLAEPLACCINGQEQVGIALGDSVVVIGAGPIGCMHVVLAKLRGAASVIAVDTVSQRLVVANEVGATRTICSSNEDPVASVLELTGQLGADVVIVACASAEAQVQALQMCSRRGRVLLFGGLPPGRVASIDTNLVHYRQILVTGSHASTALQNKLAVQLLASGTIPAEKLLTHTEPLERIREVFASAMSAAQMKIAIRPN
ncbi:MAG: zinc-dependent dehydrogenase [Bacillota bacterium]